MKRLLLFAGIIACTGANANPETRAKIDKQFHGKCSVQCELDRDDLLDAERIFFQRVNAFAMQKPKQMIAEYDVNIWFGVLKHIAKRDGFTAEQRKVLEQLYLPMIEEQADKIIEGGK